MARTVVSRLRLGGLGGELPRKFHSPLRGLLGLGPLVIKSHDPLAGLGQMALERCGDLGLSLLQPLVASDQEWLGVGVFLLAQQARAEQALVVELWPVAVGVLSRVV